VLLVDRRRHIGGNAYDHYDDAGILVHKYGPHIFHTNSKKYLIICPVYGSGGNISIRCWARCGMGNWSPIPINLDTLISCTIN